MTAQTPGCGSTSDARKRLAYSAEAESGHDAGFIAGYDQARQDFAVARCQEVHPDRWDMKYGRRLCAACISWAGVVVPAAESGGLREAVEALADEWQQRWSEGRSLDDPVTRFLTCDMAAGRLLSLLASHSTEGGADRG